MDRVERAVRAAVRVASWHGVKSTEPIVLRDRANLLVALEPAPVVARIPGLTALARPHPEEWLAREVAVAAFAAANGAPVVAPSDELPPGPHCCDGSWMTFSRRVDVVDEPAPAPERFGALVRELHEALAGFSGVLPHLTPLIEIPTMVDVLAPILEAADVAALRAEYDRAVLPLLRAPHVGSQALHGDSNVHNLVATADGFRWNDFEDTGAGPVAWDLACAAHRGADDRSVLLAGYGGTVDGSELEVFVRARELQGLVWLLLIGTRYRDRADEGRRRLDALRRA